MKFFCKHDWKMLSETTTKSQLEHMREVGFSPETIDRFVLDRKHIQVITCNECGKLKRFVENI